MSHHETSRLLAGLNNPSPAVRRESVRALGGIGERSAIPALIDHLADGDPDVEDAAAEALTKLRGRDVAARLVPMLSLEHVGLRNRAMQLLRRVGGDAPDLLLRMLQDGDRDQRIFCADIIGSLRVGGAVKALCAALLRDPDPNVRAAAATSLGQQRDPTCLPSLVESLGDDEWIQFAVVEAMANIGDPAAVDPLLGHMEHCSELVRARIAEALGELADPKSAPHLLEAIAKAQGMLLCLLCGALIKTAEPGALLGLADNLREKVYAGLLDALYEPSEQLQALALRGLCVLADSGAVYSILDLARDTDSETIAQLAQQALCAIGATPPLLSAARDPDARLAGAAISTLSRLGGHEAHRILREALQHPSASVRRLAVAGLGRLSHASDIDHLLALSADPEPSVVVEVAKALGQSGRPEVLGRLGELLEHDDPEARLQALASMLRMPGERLMDVLERGLVAADAKRRQLCAIGLGQLKAEKALEQLVRLLDDQEPGVRQAATWALLQGRDLAPLAHLEKVLDDPAREVRLALVEALAQTADPAGHALLIRAMDDADMDIRLLAIRSLGQARATDAVTALVARLTAAETTVKLAAAAALGEIGDPTAEVMLLGLLADDNPTVRQVANDAIQKIGGRF